MSIQDWGSVGEILGGLAVLATLVYLSVQIREFKKATLARGNEFSMQVFSNWRRSAMSNSEVVEVLAKANSGETLSDSERIRLELVADEFFFTNMSSYLNSRTAGTSYDDTAEIQYTLDMFGRYPCLIVEWERFRPNIDLGAPEYGEAIDAALKQRSAT